MPAQHRTGAPHAPARPALLLAASLLVNAAPAVGQVGIEDYRRAERFLPPQVNDLVLNERVAPGWIGGTDRFWYRRTQRDGHAFVLVDAPAGTRGPAFDHDRLAAAIARALGPDADIQPDRLPLDGLAFDDDARAITFTVRGTPVRCTLTDYACARAPRPAAPPPGTSPDGRWTAFVREYDLYVRHTENGAEVRLTHDGARHQAWATRLPSPTLMIQQGSEEPETPPAVFWSPDSRRLLTYRIDARDVGRLSMVQHAPSGRVRPFAYTYAYPLPEDSILPVAEPAIFDVEARRRTPVRMEPIALQYYGGPSFTWFPDGTRAYTVVADRGFTNRQVRAIDAETGEVRVLVDEVGDPYVDTSGGTILELVDGGESLLWGSERDGWTHLYLYDGRSGRVRRQLTQGEWVVRGISRIDEAERTVYFTASGREPGRDPYLVHLYRIGLDGRGLQLLTPEPAEHAVTLSPTGRYFVDTWSRVDLPPVSALRRTRDGGIVQELERADITALEATGWRMPEPFTGTAADGETDLYAIIWRPSTFDASRRYPVIEQIYTGPQNFFVPKAFTAFRNAAQTIAELGFIVVQIDGRGTARRGRAFHSVAYRNLGGVGLDDHIAVLRQMAATYPYMDLSRVGIYGGSAGGYDAVRALLHRPEFYKVGVATAGNHDHRMDKAWWNTQWMGWPVGDHYREQSNVTNAHRLEGRLLLAHGDVDENVPVSATLQLVNALIAADKDFDLVIMTNSNHGFGDNPHFIRRRWDFFVRHLYGIEPPAQFRLQARTAAQAATGN